MDKPNSVKNAVWLLYGVLGIEVLSSIMYISQSQLPRELRQGGLTGGFVTLCMQWFVINGIGKGRNWARITALVYFILGILVAIFILPTSFGRWYLERNNGIIFIFAIILYRGTLGIALVFLFQKSSSDWFRQRKNILTGHNYDDHTAAAQGDAEAQFRLGFMYANGQGVTQSDTQAIYWYHKAAEQGHVSAQFNLGFRYAKGNGVPQDDARAFYWYQKAADQGDVDAQCALGFMYAKGKGVTQSESQAAYWYQEAAEQGDADAQFHLGFRYAKGKGVPQSDTRALYWYQKAAEQGHAKAQAYIVQRSKTNCNSFDG